MAVLASASAEKITEASKSMESSPSRRSSDAASDSSFSSPVVLENPDPSFQVNSPSNSHRDVEFQSAASLRSEEYRQLFRLPPEEVLVQDYNCALQENILLQGHMYVFVHYICFYSNIFGFETKKIISFHEVSCVRKAKTAGIFPTAIEIFSGGRKYIFASFLSRDEAFKLINDGWSQHVNGAKTVTEQQESISESSCQENGQVEIDGVKSFKYPPNELDSVDRNGDASTSNDPNLPPSIEDEIPTPPPEAQDNVEEGAHPVLVTGTSASKKTSIWVEEDSDAPKIPECYTKVAEAKFSIKVETFFTFFFSDDAVDFVESFHKRCGDKDFKCSPWFPHDKHGNARDVSFQHPIKLYLGAKYGSCQEIQKFRVYRNSHLIIHTSQEISDVPYGDYFRVEGLWDLERDGDESKECCVLRVYVNVAFSKKTFWKGKIEQSTVEECREAYATWISSAHELLKQKNLEKLEEERPAASIVQNKPVLTERQAEGMTPSEQSYEANNAVRITQVSDYKGVEQQVDSIFHGNLVYSNVVSLIKESMVKFSALLRSQSHLPVLLVFFAVIIILMQLSIVVLLARPPQVRMISQVDYISGMHGGVGERSSETAAWLEKRVHYLKDEMLMVESRLEKMQLEQRLLKAQLEDLELLRRQQI